MRFSERVLVLTYRELGERFKSVGVDVEDALEAILEHDLWKLRQVRSNFGDLH
jgi:archaellum biogenesis protein FlaJ (TadC family)